jgi:hypothetical protein
MSYLAAHNAIRSRFNSQWAGATAVAYDNAAFKVPVTDTAWVRLTILDAESMQASMGASNNFYRHPGLIVVDIFTPTGVGDSVALGYVDSVVAIFRSWTDSGSGVRVYSPEVQQIGAEDKWYHTKVQFYFERDSIS